MQEDVLGTRRTAISDPLVTCALCNKVTRLRYARIIQSDVLSDSYSEYEYLCPECQKALADGKRESHKQFVPCSFCHISRFLGCSAE